MIEQTLEEYLLKDIVEMLQKNIAESDANIIVMVDNFTTWNPAHAKADILVHLASTDGVNELVEDLEIQVYLYARKYTGLWSAHAYNSAIKTALRNKRSVFAASKISFEGCKFQGTNNQIWNYVSFFSVKVNTCADLKALVEKNKKTPEST